MYAIIFVILTIVITTIVYKKEQCSSSSDLFGCFLISLGIQVSIIGIMTIVCALYMIKPL